MTASTTGRAVAVVGTGASDASVWGLARASHNATSATATLRPTAASVATTVSCTRRR